MPVTYAIRPSLKIVLIVFTGSVTDEELLKGQHNLFEDARFTGQLARIVDCTHAINIRASSDTIQSVATEAVRKGMTQIAIIATNPAVYGVASMYQAYASQADCQIFHELSAAVRWIAETIGPFITSNRCHTCDAPLRTGRDNIHATDCPFYQCARAGERALPPHLASHSDRRGLSFKRGI